MTPIRLRIRELREARGWSQTDLAKASGVHKDTISRLELGKRAGVDFDTLERLAGALEVDPALLIVTTKD